MVAELLRLRARLLVNAFRRPAGAVLGILIGFSAAGLALVAAWNIAPTLTEQDDVYVGRLLSTLGAFLIAAAFLVPLIFVRTQNLHPRAFRIFGFRKSTVVGILLLFAIFGPLALFLAVAYLPVVAWPDAASREIAAVAAPLIFFVFLFAVLIGRLAGVVLQRYPRTSTFVRVVSIVILIAWIAVIATIVAQRVPSLFWVVRWTGPISFLRRLPEVLAESPLGMLWAAPGYASSTGDEPQNAWTIIVAGAVLVLLLFIAWAVLVTVQLRPTRRLAVTRRSLSMGWFGRLPSTPAGAVAARSFSYWLRDPRYRTVFALLVVLPIVILGAFWVGGVPFAYGSLVPLPVMVIVLGWSTTHNDVAYDSTAIWNHLAARTHGAQDRLGRAVPVLVFGALLLAIGVPLTVWAHGDPGIAPAVLGVNLALLLSAVGVSSVASARFPYPAPRPGDHAFQQPQISGSSGASTQGYTLLAIVLLATPAFVSAGMWFAQGGAWAWITLLMGGVAGVLALVYGLRGGAEIFDRRAPELLAFTMRN